MSILIGRWRRRVASSQCYPRCRIAVEMPIRRIASVRDCIVKPTLSTSLQPQHIRHCCRAALRCAALNIRMAVAATAYISRRCHVTWPHSCGKWTVPTYLSQRARARAECRLGAPARLSSRSSQAFSLALSLFVSKRARIVAARVAAIGAGGKA